MCSTAVKYVLFKTYCLWLLPVSTDSKPATIDVLRSFLAYRSKN